MKVCRGVFVVFVFAVLIPFHAAHGTPEGITMPTYSAADNINAGPLSGASDPLSTPLSNEDKYIRTHQMLTYLRTQGPTWVPGLPNYVRDPAGWAMGTMHGMRDELALENTDSGNQSIVASAAQPVAALTKPPSDNTNEAIWLSPDYHHMGFLPAHDALVMGVGARHVVWNNHMQVEVRPFYGQNWHAMEGYGGTETAINLSGFGMGDGKPWGKIAIRYTEGNPDMLDHNHGTDMHAELKFTDHLALHAGVRQSDDFGLGNYAMVRWQLAGSPFGH